MNEVSKEDYSFDKLLDLSDEEVHKMVSDIVKMVDDISVELRTMIPKIDDDDVLILNPEFKLWMMTCLIIEGSQKDTFNSDFNRMLCYMFKCSGENILKFLQQYDIESVKASDGKLMGFNLIVKQGDDYE